MVRTLAAALFTLALAAGCGSQQTDVKTPEGDGSEGATTDQAGGEKTPDEGGDAKPEGGGDAKPDAKPAAASKSMSETETLARDIIKGGGRRIGWSATKKLFVVPSEKRTETSFSIDVLFYGEDGQSRDPMRICQPGECEERLDEILKEVLPKLAQKLEDGGFVTIRSIGWPDGRDELEVSSLGMKLKYTKGRVDGLKEGAKPVAFTVAGGRLDAPSLKAVFLVPDTKLLGVFATPSKAGVVQTFHVLKMP
jgi:hypothetical protein